jgi:superfamily I DNA/RNA helicase
VFDAEVASAAANVVALVYDLHASATRLPTSALLDRALERSGYSAWLERHPEGGARLRALDRLRALARHAEADLGEWLDGLMLGDYEEPLPQAEATRLSSIHQAKGGEWRATFLPGLEGASC